MQRDGLVLQCGATFGGGDQVFGEPALEGVAGEPVSLAGREERIVRAASSFVDTHAQDRGRDLGERRDPLFASLPSAVDVRAVAEMHVGDVPAG